MVDNLRKELESRIAEEAAQIGDREIALENLRMKVAEHRNDPSNERTLYEWAWAYLVAVAAGAPDNQLVEATIGPNSLTRE